MDHLINSDGLVIVRRRAVRNESGSECGGGLGFGSFDEAGQRRGLHCRLRICAHYKIWPHHAVKIRPSATGHVFFSRFAWAAKHLDVTSLLAIGSAVYAGVREQYLRLREMQPATPGIDGAESTPYFGDPQFGTPLGRLKAKSAISCSAVELLKAASAVMAIWTVSPPNKMLSWLRANTKRTSPIMGSSSAVFQPISGHTTISPFERLSHTIGRSIRLFYDLILLGTVPVLQSNRFGLRGCFLESERKIAPAEAAA